MQIAYAIKPASQPNGDVEMTTQTQTSFEAFTTEGERNVARALVRALLDEGSSISVSDGTEWTVKKSRDEAEVLAALATTGVDHIRARDAAGNSMGIFDLVWGNDEDGSELVSDHTDNDFCNAIWSGLPFE
jgi:acetyl-CoA carboxylase carboxyltransferase component